MAITVTTSLYEGVHGHKPRPSVRAVWVFLIERRPGEFTEFQTTDTYRDALREAKAEAKLIGGARRIIPQP
jgi:hypothetical protein